VEEVSSKGSCVGMQVDEFVEDGDKEDWDLYKRSLDDFSIPN